MTSEHEPELPDPAMAEAPDPAMAEPAGTDGGTGMEGATPSMPPMPATPGASSAPSTPETEPGISSSVSPADARRALAMDGSIAESADVPRAATAPDAAMAGAATGMPGSVTSAGPMLGQTTIADPLVPASPGAPPPAGTADPAASDVTAKRRSRPRAAVRGGLRVVQFAFGVALFVLGVWIGTLIFQANQKPSDVAAASASSNGITTPPVVQEFADALERGGPDAVRSSISTDVFALLTSELNRWSYATITHVDVLGTAQDGPRTATGLILTGSTTDGRTMWINLVVHTDDGKISTLR